MNAAILIDLILKGAMQLQQYAALIQKSRAEGRDVSDEELANLFVGDDLARTQLQAAIDARGGGK
jgi:hypothetical protein